MAYWIALPPNLAEVHNVFHVSMLRKYLYDEGHVVDYSELRVEPDLTYEEQPIQILDREIKRLRNKQVALVKVLWRSQRYEEAT